ncbi:hypothetical protein VHEMI02161 [[Torrubiella] hemipterigena]|uniref:AB hydrolase-1 domain-containing protein n=1 Tax=[Torrubiella] hemipterigena TaxID=1531966 RepID=A0A0A1T7C8_9HYPO|nr:hypothetical protein VHEMI02161 [[Torrubiella] hemipterigena]
MRDEWVKFDWRKVERRINLVLNYKMEIEDIGTIFDIYFLALFSERTDATPVLLLHGWPGSVLEFMEMVELLKTKYTPADLPYHVIVPSWPGFEFSSSPQIDTDFGTHDVARIFDKLMAQLGLGSGYIAQGGDLGSRVARILAAKYESVKAVHLNYCFMPDPGTTAAEEYSAVEKESLARIQLFIAMGSAYGLIQATKPSTIGLTLSSSLIALLA